MQYTLLAVQLNRDECVSSDQAAVHLDMSNVSR